jgi:SAM-dependent methyltransferase
MIFLIEQISHWLWRPAKSEPAHAFDVRHGVDTSGLYYADRLPTGHAHDRYSEGYYATAPSLFHGAMALWAGTLPTGVRVEDYAFLDLGCGKGRVVMMASLYPFCSVEGIELNAGLVRVARRNLRRWMQDQSRIGRAACRDVRVEQGDVLGLDLPDGPVVLFLFNSFGAEVLAALMEKLARIGAWRGAPVDLIYIHPDHDRLLAATPGVKLLCCEEIPFSGEDAGADLFGAASDVCSVYRVSDRRR